MGLDERPLGALQLAGLVALPEGLGEVPLEEQLVGAAHFDLHGGWPGLNIL